MRRFESSYEPLVPQGIRMRAASPADADDIIRLSETEFGADRAATQASVVTDYAEWSRHKMPTIVARDADGTFLGFSFSKPNEAGDFMRTEGQVAVLA